MNRLKCMHIRIEPHKTTAAWSCPFAIVFKKSDWDFFLMILRFICYMYQVFFCLFGVFWRHQEGNSWLVWGVKQMQKSETSQIKISAWAVRSVELCHSSSSSAMILLLSVCKMSFDLLSILARSSHLRLWLSFQGQIFRPTRTLESPSPHRNW